MSEKAKKQKAQQKKPKYCEKTVKKRDAIMKRANTLGITPNEVDNYLRTFATFDKNNDGTISANEVEMVFKALNQNVSKADVDALIKKSDKDSDGQLDFEEFVELMHSNRSKPAPSDEQTRWKDLFSFFDIDKNGKISANELEKTMKILGYDISLDYAKELVKSVDKDGDGEITFDEFVKLMKELDQK
ncbi:calmodulin-like protein [Dinothrombium tinctorium]|uniref:Calmodulin-like protein n=1 Tax=Dinothrombium tinctorium TaxID=1965070 RepID=A0A3S3QNV1_9ACAR|nr:calmodulin-like protein [Dinothrombium tinctorium]